MLILGTLRLQYRYMRLSKKSQINQRRLLERKIKSWLPVREDRIPPSGWLKAIRGALGINSRQLAARLGIEHSAILQFEKREAEGKVSLETLHKVARAMHCQFIYAIVPEVPFSDLESVLDNQAIKAASALISNVDHTMRLEQQGLTAEQSCAQTVDLAKRLKDEMDSSLWSTTQTLLGRRKEK